MPTNPTSNPSPETRDGGHAHATDADLAGPRRDSEKDTGTPQPGEGSKSMDGTKSDKPEAELGHS